MHINMHRSNCIDLTSSIHHSPLMIVRYVKILTLVNLLACSICASQTKHVVSVPATDGILLDGTYYVPSTPAPNGGFPVIIFVHGFAMSKDETDASARIYAQMGYLTFTYSVRGHGNSQGLCTIMSFKERDDLRTVVSYVSRLPGVSARNIGITGGSQGGLHGLWAAADNLPVKAITADVIGPHWASDMLANGCYRSTLTYLLSASSVRFDSVRDTLVRHFYADDYDGFRNTFIPARDIDSQAIESARTPLMMFGKWQDHYFRANEGISAYSVYRAHKDAEKLYIGTGGHYSDDIPAEWNYQFGWITRWFDQLLLNNQNGILRDPDVTYAFSSLPMDTNGYFTWTRRTLQDWPPPSITPFRMYLSEAGSLLLQPSSTVNGERTLLNDFRDSTYSPYWAFWDDFQGEWFDSSFHQQRLVFQTQPLSSPVDWVGIPRMHLYVSSSADKFPINAQVYEVDASGNKYFINRINFEGRRNLPGSMVVVDAGGNAHAHHFMPGNSIRIELTNLDRTNRKLLGDYPFVVPVFKRSQTRIFMDPAHPSYIELPILPGGTPLEVDEASSSNPTEYRLSQNYPDPFNPATTIRFSLPRASRVKLSVYDLLGREVHKLLNQEIGAGDTEIEWDASGFASGAYYYRITATDLSGSKKTFTQTRKMSLTK